MNLQETIKRILREETSTQSKLMDKISNMGFYKTSRMFGGIQNLYKVLGFTGTQEEMIFIVDTIMRHDVTVIENICDFKIEPTLHSLKLYVEIPKYYPNLADDSWANRQRVLRARDNITTIIERLGNDLVRGHIVNVSVGKC
jgi:hypothetical protein